MRVLITGSSGWLGRFTAPRFEAAGHAVIGLDLAPGPWTRVTGSVADRELVDRTFGEHGVEAVVHCAALHKPDMQRYPDHAFVDVNVTGTLNLLAAAVTAGHDRFVMTSTTSLMISRALREGRRDAAAWLDEGSGPLEPRNIYGVTKLAAEGLCRQHHNEHGIACVVLRTGRFFPEDDDTLRDPAGENLKANEFLNRRLTVEDAARAHLLAFERAPELGFDLSVLSAPPPFHRDQAPALARDAAAVVEARFPDVRELYGTRGWSLPRTLDRVYDPGHAERRWGFRCETDFAAILGALRRGEPLPFVHDPGYQPPHVEGPGA